MYMIRKKKRKQKITEGTAKNRFLKSSIKKIKKKGERKNWAMYRTIRPIKQDVVHSHARKIYKIVVYCVATYIQINTNVAI